MGSRRGFIIRMKIGNVVPGSMDSVSAASHCIRVRKRSTLGPSADGQQYAVVHVTGYIKNWPPAGQPVFVILLHCTFSVVICQLHHLVKVAVFCMDASWCFYSSCFFLVLLGDYGSADFNDV